MEEILRLFGIVFFVVWLGIGAAMIVLVATSDAVITSENWQCTKLAVNNDCTSWVRRAK